MAARPLRRRGGRHVGLLLAGWGAFNLVEGLVDHQLLGIHHVRDDLGDPLGWDLAFLALGAALMCVGSVAAATLTHADQPLTPRVPHQSRVGWPHVRPHESRGHLRAGCAQPDGRALAAHVW